MLSVQPGAGYLSGMALETISLDWIEDQARRNMEFRIDCRDKIKEDANRTLSLILVASGAALGFFLNGYNPAFGMRFQSWETLAPTLLVAVYLAALAVALITRVLQIQTVRPPTNDPGNLLKLEGKYSCDQLRRFELDSLNKGIKHAADRNKRTAAELNRIQLLLCGAPVLFVVVFALVSLV